MSLRQRLFSWPLLAVAAFLTASGWLAPGSARADEATAPGAGSEASPQPQRANEPAASSSSPSSAAPSTKDEGKAPDSGTPTPAKPAAPKPPPATAPSSGAASSGAASPGQAPIPEHATVLSKDQIEGVIGKKVLSSTGEDMGEIINVIVDRDGQPRAAIIDFGGFLGVGTRRIAVEWNALHFSPSGKPDQVTLGLTRDQLKAAPEYQDGKPVIALGVSGGTQTLPDAEFP